MITKTNTPSPLENSAEKSEAKNQPQPSGAQPDKTEGKAVAQFPFRRHGHVAGGKMSPEYQSWRAMIQRCTNPKNNRFEYYGSRGISICERWMNFANFFEDMGTKPTERHSIERKDNEKGYSKENCKWGTIQEQARNKTTSRRITIDGETLHVKEWSLRGGVSASLIWARLRLLGWDPKRAVFEVPRKAAS